MNIITRLVVVLIAVSIPLVSHADQAFDFKGLHVGMDITSVVNSNKEFLCSEIYSRRVLHCVLPRTVGTPFATIGGVQVWWIRLDALDNKIVMIAAGLACGKDEYYHNTIIEQAANAVVNKYGQPTTTSSKFYPTNGGGKEGGTIMKWEKGDTKMILGDYVGTWSMLGIATDRYDSIVTAGVYEQIREKCLYLRDYPYHVPNVADYVPNKKVKEYCEGQATRAGMRVFSQYHSLLDEYVNYGLLIVSPEKVEEMGNASLDGQRRKAEVERNEKNEADQPKQRAKDL